MLTIADMVEGGVKITEKGLTYSMEGPLVLTNSQFNDMNA